MAQSVIIPEVMWVFNPTYIKVKDIEEASSVSVTIGGRSLSMPVFVGDTDIQINTLAQLLFDEPRNVRSLKFEITIEGAVETTGTILAIWGCLDYGDKLLQFGRMSNDVILRKVRYYTNFPFSIDELSENGFVTKVITQGGDYESSFVKGKVITRVIENNEKEGLYIRWIDRFGFMQYFLFKKGDKDLKTASDSNEITELKNVYGMGYSVHYRPLQVTSLESVKICADNLDLDEIEYVTSIVGSPLVDLYIDGEWKPIRIEDGSYQYSVHHLTQKQDFELSIIVNDRDSQSL